MSSVFLSYSTADKARVAAIADRLSAAGLKVWRDEQDMRGGDLLADSIGTALYTHRYVAVLLSEASAESWWVRLEYSIAIDREAVENRPIVIPILLEDVEVPPCLRGRLWIDFTDEARIDAHFDKLLAALGAAPIPARAATPAGRGVLQVTNALGGPILFLFARECGTQDWGIDRLPPDPVKGTIQPGDSTTLELSPGCWEMRVDHLATLAPGQLLTKATRLDPVLPGTRTSWLVVNPWR